MQDVGKVKDFWEKRATTNEIDDREVTHRDVWQRWLEVDMIKKYLKPTDRVLDIGCGNGFTTHQISPLVAEVVGMDYSEAMIKRANAAKAAENGGKLKFAVGDVTKLNPSAFGLFDLAISERCLINLASWEEQKRALDNIASVLKPGARFLFIEGGEEGRTQLNQVREAVGLEAMPPVWHNINFKTSDLLSHLGRQFTVEESLHFGVYDFISRVVHPLLVAPEVPQYDSRINQIAAQLTTKLQEFGEISRVLFWVLKRKSS